MKVYVMPELKTLIEKTAATASLKNKCLLFASELLIKAAEGEDKEEYFPLTATLCMYTYTRRAFYAVKEILFSIGAVECNDEYLSARSAKKIMEVYGITADPYSKGYRLAARFHEPEEWEIHDPKLEKRRYQALANASYASMTGIARAWILESYKNVTFSPAAPQILEELVFKSRSAEARARHHFAVVNERRPCFMAKKSGRLYYSVASLNKKLRAELLLDGERTCELDIAACQPTLLATLYSADDPAHMEERSRYLAFAQSGTLYEQFSEWGGQNWSRDDAKTQFFHQIAYGSAWCAEKYDLLPIFSAQFPILAELMHQVKLGGNSVLPVRMQTLEADIVIKGTIGELAGMGIKALPVHDALIVKVRDASRAALVFARHWEQKTGMPAQIKGAAA